MMLDDSQSLIETRDAELKGLLESYEITSSKEQRKQLLKHLELLIKVNKNINLTRITSIDDALNLHILDSLLPLKVCPKFSTANKKYVDIGTGGGFPGIPLSIMSNNQAYLIDSIGKKVDAVQNMIIQLGISKRVSSVKLRAEEIPNSFKRSFDYVSFRAVAKTNTLLEYAEPFLAIGGFLIVMKANIDQIELQNGFQAAKIFGYKCVSRETFELPSNYGHREILLFQKQFKSEIKLPRQTGMAKLKPVGIKNQ